MSAKKVPYREPDLPSNYEEDEEVLEEENKKPESPWAWAVLMLLSIEAAIAYFWAFQPSVFVVCAAFDVCLLSVLRIHHLEVRRLREKDEKVKWTGYAFRAFEVLVEGTEDTTMVQAIRQFNADLTLREARKVEEHVRANRDRT